MNIELLLLCESVALQSAVLPESIIAGNLLQFLWCLFLKIITYNVQKVKHFISNVAGLEKLFKVLLQHVKGTNHLDCIFTFPLPSWLPSHGGSRTPAGQGWLS